MSVSLRGDPVTQKATTTRSLGARTCQTPLLGQPAPRWRVPLDESHGKRRLNGLYTFAVSPRTEASLAMNAPGPSWLDFAVQYAAHAANIDSVAAGLPVVYHKVYNISFWGLERLHAFDSRKFSKVFKTLQTQGLLEKV
jgi:hypothetical protein